MNLGLKPPKMFETFPGEKSTGSDGAKLQRHLWTAQLRRREVMIGAAVEDLWFVGNDDEHKRRLRSWKGQTKHSTVESTYQMMA